MINHRRKQSSRQNPAVGAEATAEGLGTAPRRGLQLCVNRSKPRMSGSAPGLPQGGFFWTTGRRGGGFPLYNPHGISKVSFTPYNKIFSSPTWERAFFGANFPRGSVPPNLPALFGVCALRKSQQRPQRGGQP